MTGRSVLVTGASSGIGGATVDELVRRGFHVWATVRRAEDEARLAERHGDDITVLRCDVTDADEVAAVSRRIRAHPQGLYGLVNNAGTAIPAPLEFMPLDEFRRQLDINLTGQLAVTQAVLSCLRESRGRVVNIGSIGGRIAGPVLGAYHASKFGLVGLTDTLRAELAPSGIAVVLVEPGTIATPIWHTGAAAGERLLADLPPEGLTLYRAQIDRTRAQARHAARNGLPPSAVAAVIATALTARNPRPRYLVGRDAKVISVVARLPYRLRYKLTAGRA